MAETLLAPLELLEPLEHCLEPLLEPGRHSFSQSCRIRLSESQVSLEGIAFTELGSLGISIWA